jgi:hypothetical protein
MEYLLKTALSQFKKYGKIELVIYPNRDYSNPELYIYTDFKEAFDHMDYIYKNSSDDIKIKNN